MSSPTVPTKRSNACVPCHQRKVKCDAAVRGTPCSRCASKGRSQICSLLPPRRQRRPAKRSDDNVQRSRDEWDAAQQLAFIADQNNRTDDGFTSAIEAPREQHWTPTPSRTTDSIAPAPEPAGGVSEEDAQLHTLQLMAHQNDPANICTSLDQANGSPEVIEYIDKLNSVSILSEVLGQRQQRRLIRLGVDNFPTVSAKHREIAGLEASDVSYLESKGAFDEPDTLWGIKLLRLWFEHVYPYTPILDPSRFFEEYERGTCSHFLLFALLANVAHYASSEDLLAVGYRDRCTAQRDYVRKAQLLYDFGCERHQLTMLQGSLILSSIQASFAPIKDFRFWFHNTVRIATQMGLHRRNLGDDLDPATFKLCRRIWWAVRTRDILFNLSGFLNARCINDSEVDVDALTEDDWSDAYDQNEQARMTPLSTKLHRHFFIQKCNLSCLEANFLRLSRERTDPITLPTAKAFVDRLRAWRNGLPEVLQPSQVLTWTKDNVWIIILMTHAYRLECVLLRTARESSRLHGDQSGASWCKQQLTSCVFELDTFIGRAIMHNLVQLAPGSFIVCACNLLAFYIEIALEQGSSTSQKTTAKSRIHVILSYLRDVGDNWRMARWTFRVSDWVVKRAGLVLQTDTDSANGDDARHNSGVTSGTPFQHFASGLDASLSEHWIQDFLDQNFYGQLHEELLNFGPV